MFEFFVRRSRHRPLDRFCRGLVPLLGIFLLNGCATVDYYQQLASGQWSLLRAREPVEKVIADPTRAPTLRSRLAEAEQARTFASERLGLPNNRSYRLYADIHRPFVVWNVFATAEFSLDPVQYCFPIAGCVAYRGYYQQGRARGAAALLRQQGLDVYMGGVEAYSTLGWFDDPIVSSMMGWGSERLATLIFHELAHQRFYLPGDTPFNESFATFVEQEGTRQWRAARGLPAETDDQNARRDAFVRLVLDLRKRLETLYSQPLAPDAMRVAKQAEIDRLRREYRQLRDSQWGGRGAYDAWVEAPINNAKLLPFGLYDQWVPAFAVLYRQAGGDWPAFYRAVRTLGALPAPQRQQALEALLAKSQV
ncbi:aminopeptidase [Pseudomonas sp. RIT-PI-S]|uniref:aminopeptidase n=1 Tax=Pseudomonas sp. RIT-PI-S TaxID=3035295 RepID=UPI0021DB4E92|nr:aminopeptidase [Pseudomonas sp. RIT-PI-S]